MSLVLLRLIMQELCWFAAINKLNKHRQQFDGAQQKIKCDQIV